MRHSECELAHRAIGVFWFDVIEKVVFWRFIRICAFEFISEVGDEPCDGDDGHNNINGVCSGRVHLRDETAVRDILLRATQAIGRVNLVYIVNDRKNQNNESNCE